MTENKKNGLYRRSSTAPVFVADKKSNNRLQSFIEKNLSQNDEKFIYALESRQPLRITIPQEALREWFAPMSKNYMRDIMYACENLMNRRIKAIKGNSFDIINVFTRCTLDEQGSLHIEVSPEGVSAYNFIEDKKYLLYDAMTISNFDRAETSFFYDKAIRTLGKREWSFECSVDELKEQFQNVSFIEKKTADGPVLIERKNFSDSQLKNKIIDPVIKDLKNKFDDKFIDFFLECGDVKTEVRGGRGRKKISSYIFNIIQILPQVDEEKGIMLQEITILLTQYIEDKARVFRLMQPWNHKDMDISMISRLKKNLSYFESKYKKGGVDNAIGYLITIMNPKNIYKDVKDIIISDSNYANSKWNVIQKAFKESCKDSGASMIENFVVGYYTEETNILGLRMISSQQTYLQFVYDKKFYDILIPLCKSEFGDNLTINIIYESQGNIKEHTLLNVN